MKEWKEYRLSDIATLTTGFPFDGHKYHKEGIRVVRGDNVTIGNLRWDSDKDKRWKEAFNRFDEFSLKADDIVISMDGSRVGKNRAKVKKEDLPLLLAQRVACIRHDNKSLQDFLYYSIFNKKFESYITSVHTGTSIPHISLKQIGDFKIKLPNIDIQNKVVSVLSSLDDKIELNRKINENLDQQVQALFKSWFIDFEPFKDGKFVESELGMIPEGWKLESLTVVASYLNGLAMQKYPPYDLKHSLPVLKIKELGLKNCDENSDRCSSDIESKYIVNVGDIIFSWSGTLIVDIWTGEKSGLNQHLFKVTPNSGYSKAFVYYWTKHYLDKFIRIAKDKAVTMGHIKRTDLDSSYVLLPENNILEKFDNLVSPIMQQMITIRVESNRLSSIRDTLLPKLMSGEIKLK